MPRYAIGTIEGRNYHEQKTSIHKNIQTTYLILQKFIDFTRYGEPPIIYMGYIIIRAVFLLLSSSARGFWSSLPCFRSWECRQVLNSETANLSPFPPNYTEDIFWFFWSHRPVAQMNQELRHSRKGNSSLSDSISFFSWA